MWQHKVYVIWDNGKGEMKNDTLRSTSSIKISNHQFYVAKWTKQPYKQGNYLFFFALNAEEMELSRSIAIALQT